MITKYYTGANLTGTSGNIGRHLDADMAVSMITIDTFTLQPTWDYSAAGSIITFLNNVWDDQPMNHLGAEFTGTDGMIGRTLNITVGVHYMLVVDNFMLQKDIDYSTYNTTLTMNNPLWDDQRVTLWVVE
jgi:hypothetical protein